VQSARECRLVALPAVDGKQYGYRVYAPEEAMPRLPPRHFHGTIPTPFLTVHQY
jgi:hypothetical protein